MNTRRTALAALALALACGTSHAQTMIGSGKTALSYPITLTQPGTYKLASHLVAPAGQTAIQVAAPNVVIDLNGFTISSAAPVCSGDWPTLTCASGFYAAGVRNTGNHENITVRNGTISGFSHGIHLYRRSLVEDVVLERNAVYGAMLASGSVVRGVRAAQNKNAGIYAMQSVVQGSTSSGTQTAFFMDGGLLQNAISYDSHWAVYSNASGGGYVGVRESVFQSTSNTFQGGVQSLGNNLCNNLGC